MIRLTEGTSKQVIETSDVLNVLIGTLNNMVDVRACNKPVERVSLLHLFVESENLTTNERRRVPSRHIDMRLCKASCCLWGPYVLVGLVTSATVLRYVLLRSLQHGLRNAG